MKFREWYAIFSSNFYYHFIHFFMSKSCVLCFFFFLQIRNFLLFSNNNFYLFRVEIKCRWGNERFDVRLWRNTSVLFLSPDWKSASFEERDGWKSCLIPAKVGISTLIFLDVSFSRNKFLDLRCKHFYFPPMKWYKGEMKIQRCTNFFSDALDSLRTSWKLDSWVFPFFSKK